MKLHEQRLHYFTKTFEFERESIVFEFTSTDQKDLPSRWQVTSIEPVKGFLLWSEYNYGWQGYNTLFQYSTVIGSRTYSDGRPDVHFKAIPDGLKQQISNALDEQFDHLRGKLHF